MPIGARDFNTMKAIQKSGVQSYFSGCMTLTLTTPASEEERCAQRIPSNDGKCSEILFVDLLVDMRKHFPKEIQDRASLASHKTKAGMLNNGKLRFQGWC